MMIDVWLGEVRLAVRGLLRERGVTIVAVGSLAIAIAANATVFSLVQAVEFPSLIYPEPSRIVFLESRNLERNLSELPISAPDGLDIAAAARTLASPGLTADQTSVVREAAIAARRFGREVTPAFFQVMGVAAGRGRVLAAGDTDAIVVSDRLWRTQLGGDSGLVGRVLHLNETAFTVVGIMPPRFDMDKDFWVPLSPAAGTSPRQHRQFTLFARLAPGAGLDEAAREIADISARLAAQYPATNRGWVMFPTLMTRMHGQDSRGVFFLLQAAVGFVLLIACANIANILLARGTRRSHEMAVRVALGAGRRRLVRQLLTESLVLAAVGGALGIGLALWGIRLARAIGGFPNVIDPTLNPGVLAFTAATSMLTGMLTGIVPALRASRSAPEAVLRAEGGRGETTGGRGRVRAALVALQVASAVVLAAAAGLMLQSLMNRQRVNLGFTPEGAVRADFAFAGSRYANLDVARSALEDVLNGVRRLPGVVAAGGSAFALPAGVGAQLAVALPDDANRELPGSVRRGIEAVTPEYFSAMGVPVARGRAFTPADRQGTAAVAIVNDEMARLLWPDDLGGRPLGQRLRLGTGPSAPIVTVVGVAGSIRRSAMHDFVVARVYLPFAQYPSRIVAVVMRSTGDVGQIPAGLTAAVRQVDPTVVVDGIRTVEEDVAQFLAPVRLLTLLFLAFGVTGLLLAGLGVFGAMSYAVSQREREMAVRSALGASGVNLTWLVLRSGLLITAIGVVPGALLAIALGRVLASFLYGVTPADPITIAAAAAFLGAVALAACLRPARAAASVDPMAVLRRG